MNARLGSNHRAILIEMGNIQPENPLEMENVTSHGILTKQLVPKRPNAIDMRFYWPRDRNNQNQFHLHWKPGSENIADYHANHHPPAHHR